MQLRVKLSILNASGEAFMGIGLVWLLQRIARLRSISKAAADMKMSYVKALRILDELERNLGAKVLIRTRGGNARGGASLTPFGREFVACYTELQSRVERSAQRSFARFQRKLDALPLPDRPRRSVQTAGLSR